MLCVLETLNKKVRERERPATQLTQTLNLRLLERVSFRASSQTAHIPRWRRRCFRRSWGFFCKQEASKLTWARGLRELLSSWEQGPFCLPPSAYFFQRTRHLWLTLGTLEAHLPVVGSCHLSGHPFSGTGVSSFS